MNINLSQPLPPQPIPIGFDGEHNAESLIFTLSDKFKGADYYVVLFLNNDIDTISERLYASNDTVTIPLPQSVMITGLLKTQLVAFTDGDIIAKSPVILFDVGCSIDLTDTPIEHDTSDILGDLNNLIDRINNLDDLVPDNGITSNKIADQAIKERHISDELFEQIQNGNGAIKAYTEFPTSPTEGDVFCLTAPANTSLKNYGFEKEFWGGSDELNRPYIYAIDVPLTLSFDIDTNNVPILDDGITDGYGLIIINKITNDFAAIIYGTLDGVSDKCFWMYEKSRGDDDDHYIKLGFVHAGTTIEGVTLVEKTGWYYITSDSETELTVLTPISEIDPEELLKCKIDNAIVYDLFYTDTDHLWYSAMTDDVFDKLSICADVTLNPSNYQYHNGRWVDVLHHGTTQRYIENIQWLMYRGY